MKKIAIIPTLFTLGNAVCGLAAIAYGSRITSDPATRYYLSLSALFIFLAMIFDAVDGFVARLSKTASNFGGQLDSLCDAISFGAAPAFLLLRMCQDWQTPTLRQCIAMIAALYMVCAILRLARFNVQNSPDPASHKRFKGLPSPAAAGCVASMALLRAGGFDQSWEILNSTLYNSVSVLAPLGTLLVALLMVSRVPYPHLTKQLLRGRRHFSHLVEVIVAIFLLTLLRELALVVVFWGYTLSQLLRHLYTQALRHAAVDPQTGLQDEPPQ